MIAAAVALAVAFVPHRYEFKQVHMGVVVRVALYSPSEDVAIDQAEAAFTRFAQIDQALSDYKRDSELNTLIASAGTVQPASPDLMTVLRMGAKFSALTDGAFDMTAAPIIRLWRAARKSGQMPSLQDIAAAKALVGHSRVTLDPAARTVRLEPGTLLDAGGIAKGYACTEAVAAMCAAGSPSCMVEAGGDMAFGDPPPHAEGWKVVVQGAPSMLSLARCSLSTSGDAEQFVEIAGVRYSHIVDPRTGIGVTNRRQVSVQGPTGLITDPMSTSLCILSPAEGEALAKRFGLRYWVSGPSSK